jgi:hypothetical protein
MGWTIEGSFPSGAWIFLFAKSRPQRPWSRPRLPYCLRTDDSRDQTKRDAQKKDIPISIPLMLEAATSLATFSTEQIMLEIVHDRVATGVTRVVSTAEVLRRGKQREKVLQYYSSCIASFRKQRQMGDGSSGQKNNPDLRRRVLLDEISRYRSYSSNKYQKERHSIKLRT